MLPITRFTNALVTLFIDQTTISICLLKQSATRQPIELIALRTISNATIVVDGVITNQTALQHHIAQFVRHYQIQHACIAIALNGLGIYERLVTLNQTPKDHASFAHLKLGRLSWDYNYLFSNDQGNFIYYIAGIPRELLLQYQLLCWQTSLNLVCITTAKQSFLRLYEHMYGSAFRQSQLAQDLHSCNNRLELLINASMLARLVNLRTDFSKDQLYHVLVNTGLFLDQKG